MDASWTMMLFNAEGRPAPEPRGVYTAYSRVPVPGYFQSMGQPLLQGRDFNLSDTVDAPLVCIVSQSIAKRFWPNDSPIGKRIRWGRLDGTRPWFTIVGVVGDMKAIADPRDGEVLGMIARPLAQMLVHATASLDDITFVLHTDGRSVNEQAIRAVLGRVNANLAAYNFVSLQDAAARTRTTERFIFVLVSSFGLVGLVLSAVGLYWRHRASARSARRTTRRGFAFVRLYCRCARDLWSGTPGQESMGRNAGAESNRVHLCSGRALHRGDGRVLVAGAPGRSCRSCYCTSNRMI
jgi:hypothetical protein